jgi:DNA repair protein RadA/Sms
MTNHVCATCGHSSPRWFGRCPDCGEWGAAQEPAGSEAVRITSLDAGGSERSRIGTGLPEIDRVLGGGLVEGSVVLLAGEPGIGKSTLMLQLLDGVARSGRKTLLASGEESLAQVALRAGRLRLDPRRLRGAATNSVDAIASATVSDSPDLLVVDSVQSLSGEGVDAFAGAPNQVRNCVATLQHIAKSTGAVVVLVGHITKDGAVAGPKTLEHMVDVVLSLEGERTGSLRVLRPVKNRFGACDETGVFLMTELGLAPVPDPSTLLLADRKAGAAGSAVFASLEGSRPVLIEIQALVSSETTPGSRRVAIGLDQRRLAVLTGVLDQRVHLPLAGRDVFVAAAGGMTVREPAADLAVASALFSAVTEIPLAPDVVAIGEVGLSGELRRVPGIERRLGEAARLGFGSALIPEKNSSVESSLRISAVSDLQSAFASPELVRGPETTSTMACYS